MGRRLREIGSYVPLNDTFPKTVAFVVGIRKGAQTPIGTGFFLGVRRPEVRGQRAFTSYLVTAAHVVRTEPVTWVRLRQMTGGLVDVPVRGWEFHDHDDVAVAVWDPPDTERRFDIDVMPLPGFVTGDYDQMLGDRVYFSGLFAPLRAMEEANIPLVRSGTLAAWRQPRVPMGTSPGNRAEYTMHLIDCRSYSGFSGSPCVVQFPRKRPAQPEGGVGRPGEQTELIGLISGHFDEQDESITGDIAAGDKAGAQANLGVGLVTPMESIIELLQREDVLEDRQRREQEYRRGYEKGPPAATPNVVSDDEPEYERFEDLASRVLQVPKHEVDEKRRQES